MSVELLSQERVVLDVVQDYLSSNRQFDIDDIIPYISFRLRRTSNKLNYQGIRSILIDLVKKNFLIEGSKLSSEDILNNENRKIIYSYILKNPGAYFTKIVKDLDLSNHVAVWHLSMLIKFQFIKKRIVDKHEIYFDSKIDIREAKFNFYRSLEKSKIIIHYLRNNNIGITKTRLSKALKMHINTLSKYLNILANINLVIEEKIDNKLLYFLEEESLIHNN
jgi:predicted transcriptional regulator